uniref:Uncharacterized protein n=1 Tax=Rhizophora mucronata TaxID=61149 RepID=A0A2P2R1Z8_RHIMU
MPWASALVSLLFTLHKLAFFSICHYFSLYMQKASLYYLFLFGV